MVKSITLNLSTIVAVPIGLWLCYTDRVSWWTFLLIVLLMVEVSYKITRKQKRA